MHNFVILLLFQFHFGDRLNNKILTWHEKIGGGLSTNVNALTYFGNVLTPFVEFKKMSHLGA